jgi:hypothetical protein
MFDDDISSSITNKKYLYQLHDSQLLTKDLSPYPYEMVNYVFD